MGKYARGFDNTWGIVKESGESSDFVPLTAVAS